MLKSAFGSAPQPRWTRRDSGLDATDLGAIATQALGRWRIAFSEDGEAINGGRVGIPNLNIAFGDLVTGSKTRPRPEGGTWTDSWVDIHADSDMDRDPIRR
jgi:hypothetical protein